MRLLEFEAKRILAARGISVPCGAVWPLLPEVVDQYVVKAQIPEGGRGKQRGIAFASNANEAARVARQMLDRSIGGQAVRRVYIEERLDIERELYFSVRVDRDARAYSVLASPDGGVEVETVSVDRLLDVPIDPLRGLTPDVVPRVLQFLRITPALHQAAGATVAALVAAAAEEDAELIEINPLALTRDGKIVVADAKMTVDDNAAFRHPGWSDLTLAAADDTVEGRVRAAGATAVEVDPQGTVIAVVSGAGLMMATLDLLSAAGARVRFMVDLGGTPLADRRKLVPILTAMIGLAPVVLFINAYFQTALADDFARSIVDALEMSSMTSRVIVRLKGRNAEGARRILAPHRVEMYEGLAEGLAAVLHVAGTVTKKS